MTGEGALKLFQMAWRDGTTPNVTFENVFSRPLEELLLKEHKQRHKSKKKLSKKNERDASLRLLGVNIANNSPIKLVCFMKETFRIDKRV